MKPRYIFFLIFLVGVTSAGRGQSRLFVNNSPDEVVRLDPRQQQMDVEPGQILVKFKDDVSVSPGQVNGIAKVNVTSVDALLQEFQVRTATKVFHGAQRLEQPRTLRSFSGEIFEQPSLHNIYKLELQEQGRMFEAIEQLKQDPNVEYAEPNYIFSIIGAEPLSEVLTEDDLKRAQQRTTHPANSKFEIGNSQLTIIPNDPLYSQQWYIPAVRADAVWDSTTGDTTSIISILDTGVDWLHPDLTNKIWINYAEQGGIAGVDDDGNGFVDDIRGWDFINGDNDPRDDNSHGTHVAGIAAAEADNGIGIAGVNWKAKIMPIKVFQSSGRGDAGTITQGIWYAINKGATVLNMSFGSYARSLTMENALAFAYSQAVLVAAAGNDRECIGPGVLCAPFFPAALSYVIGVQDRPLYSNYDQDGPVFSRYPDLWNYELYSPGSAILSTIPNGNYRTYTGTSMAAAVVSGAVAIYKSYFPEHSQEMMWGSLINTISDNIDLFAALTVQGQPQLWFVSQTIVDTLDGDRDGKVDAGETIELWFVVRNTWGQADSVFIEIRLGEFEDTSIAQIQQGVSFIGSVSPYARRSNEHDPFRIHIGTNVANDRDIVFQALIWNAGSTDTVRQEIALRVENGWELAGVMDSTIVLTPDKLWLVNSSFRVGSNGTLLITPGTKLILGTNLVNRGEIRSYGTRDSLIEIQGPGGFRGAGMYSFLWTKIVGTNQGFGEYPTDDGAASYYFDHCILENINAYGWTLIWSGGGSNTFFTDCVIRNCIFRWLSYVSIGEFYRSNLQDCFTGSLQFGFGHIEFVPGNFNNFSGLSSGPFGPTTAATYSSRSVTSTGNNFIGGRGEGVYMFSAIGTSDILDISNQYWGTTDSIRITKKIRDFWDSPVLPMARFWPFLTQPSDSSHGIVWKVLVNGADAQDEHVDPVGLSTVRFDVYFNRSMDTSYVPFLTFGVREPFTQQFVRDSARWSSDGRIWTAYKTIQLHTGDGINRIRVAGARDPEGFEIPIEDMRFEFLIDAAGAASAGFTATAGLGRVTLEWETPEVPDLLGHNMYRFRNLTDTTFTSPELINTTLILDTLYTDFSVTPNRRYYYYYKVVRTNFSESDSSRVVSTVPFTAALGDANGDLAVNVLDIISIVAYILGQNPQPFIFEAADVNHDTVINVLDIIGVVNIILGGSGPTVATSGSARLELVQNRLELTTDVPIAGIQLKLQGNEVNGLQFIPEGATTQFEVANGIMGDTARTYILFSISGVTLPVGQYTLGTFQGMNPTIHLTEAILSDPQGGGVITNVVDNGVPLIPTEYYLSQNYPNPFNASTTIRFGLPERAEVKIVLYNILGQEVRTYTLGEMNAGRHQVVWDARNNRGNSVASGVYFYRMNTPKFTQVKKLLMIK